jgi:hypothetical protein
MAYNEEQPQHFSGKEMDDKKMSSDKQWSAKQVIARLKKLKGERGVWETHWQDVADYVLPRKNDITSKKTAGEKRNWQLLDNTAMHSNELLAGTLHGLLTNPNSEWFELTTGNRDLDADEDVKKWLVQTSRDLHSIINRSNFQTEIHELYLDICSFGTACMLIEEDDEDVVRFSTKFISNYFIWENNQGTVDGIINSWKWSAEQLVQEFGLAKLPKKVIEVYNKGDYDTKFECAHAVYSSKLVPALAKDKVKYISHYVIVEEEFDVEVGSFTEFPFVVPRWTKASGETYGRSPGMNALPDIKVLNKMNETMLKGAQRFADPPLQMEDDGVVLPVDTTPGGINYRRPGSDPIRPVFNDTRVDFGYQAMEDRRKRVRDAYYVDQMRLQQNGPMMTATEVLQRTEESVRFIGPMMGRQQTEMAAPTVMRIYRIARDQKKIAEPPVKLKGKNLEVRYSSLIAKAQKATDGQSVMRFLQAASPFIQLDPSSADYIDASAAVKVCAAVYGPPPEVLRVERDVKQVRAARAEAQANAQQQAQNQQNVEQFNNVATTMNDMAKVQPA